MGYGIVSSGTNIDWTPTWGGFSVNPVLEYAQYTLNGKTCSLYLNVTTNGTSNSATFTLTAPFIALKTVFWVVFITDNGVNSTSGRATMSAGSNIITVGINGTTSGGFTNPGAKGIRLAGQSFIIQ